MIINLKFNHNLCLHHIYTATIMLEIHIYLWCIQPSSPSPIVANSLGIQYESGQITSPANGGDFFVQNPAGYLSNYAVG